MSNSNKALILAPFADQSRREAVLASDEVAVLRDRLAIAMDVGSVLANKMDEWTGKGLNLEALLRQTVADRDERADVSSVLRGGLRSPRERVSRGDV